MTLADELRPCPFCGGASLRQYSVHGFKAVNCGDCGGDAPLLQWNTRIEALESRAEWRSIETAPKGIPVLVAGGLAMQKTGGQWFSGMEEPLYQRELQWQPTLWMPLPATPKHAHIIPKEQNHD